MSNSVRELLAELKTGLTAEWESRTTYGKLWFPVWLVNTMLFFGFFGGLVLLKNLWDRMENNASGSLFEVYKDDD